MEDQMQSLKPVSWFTPWRWLAHWRPWKRRVLFTALIIATYIEAPALLEAAFLTANRAGIQFTAKQHDWLNAFRRVAFYPQYTAAQASPAISQFYRVQISFLMKTLN